MYPQYADGPFGVVPGMGIGGPQLGYPPAYMPMGNHGHISGGEVMTPLTVATDTRQGMEVVVEAAGGITDTVVEGITLVMCNVKVPPEQCIRTHDTRVVYILVVH